MILNNLSVSAAEDTVNLNSGIKKKAEMTEREAHDPPGFDVDPDERMVM
jgi:hypothetical protein